jgi:hypothetical protein
MGVSEGKWCKGATLFERGIPSRDAVLRIYRVGVPKSKGLIESSMTTVAYGLMGLRRDWFQMAMVLLLDKVAAAGVASRSISGSGDVTAGEFCCCWHTSGGSKVANGLSRLL